MTSESVSREFLALQAAVAGRYSLVRELGRGGMGVVFLAREVALDRLVAVKLLPPGLASQPALRDRFLREARTAAQLSHPHIVSIHSVESAADLVFFVMEYVAGETLGQRLRRTGALPPNDALRITQEVAWALSHAHARGVVHRDVKPDNIMLEEGTDRAIVMDFGIAHGGITGDTPVGVGLGTFHYMSPEQALGEPVDARTDVYALGVTAYHALTGRRPFEGYDGAALLAQQTHVDPVAVQVYAGAIHSRFAQVIDRAIQRLPEARWQSLETMAQELSAARSVTPQLPVPVRQWATKSREQMERMGLAVAVGVSSELILILGFGWNDFAGVIFHSLAMLMATFTLLSFGTLLESTRKLVREGYSRNVALRAVAHEAVAMREERVTATGWYNKPAVMVGGGALVTAIATASVNGSDALIPGVVALMIAIITPVLVLTKLWNRRRTTGGIWERLLNGRFGRMLFGMAGVGSGNVRMTATSGEPTALALGGAVGEIYGSLSEGQRHALAAVPNLIERLEAMAMDQGKNIEAVMALETLRLDLLRLRAGEIGAESITEGIDALRDVGRKVDAVLELKEETGD